MSKCFNRNAEAFLKYAAAYLKFAMAYFYFAMAYYFREVLKLFSKVIIYLLTLPLCHLERSEESREHQVGVTEIPSPIALIAQTSQLIDLQHLPV